MIKSPWLKSCAKCMRIYTAINTPSIFAPLRIRWMTNHSGLTAWYLVIYVGKRVKTNKGRPRSFVFYISPRRPLIQITSKFDWISRPLNLDFLEILWKNNDLAIFPSEKKKKVYIPIINWNMKNLIGRQRYNFYKYFSRGIEWISRKFSSIFQTSLAGRYFSNSNIPSRNHPTRTLPKYSSYRGGACIRQDEQLKQACSKSLIFPFTRRWIARQ